MRLLDLARLIVDAERLRLKLYAQRQAMRGVFAVIAALFGLFMMIMLHLTALFFLGPWLGNGFAALALVGVDVLLVLLFGLLAARDQPGAEEVEAAAVGKAARSQIGVTAAGFAMAAPMARAVGGGLRGELATTLMTHFLRRKKT